MRILVIASIALLALQPTALAAAKLQPDEVPEFRLRARVLNFGGQAPEGKKFSFGLAGVSGTAEGSQWCTEIKFGRPQAEATLKGYPAIYMSGWPVVLRLTVQGAADPTLVEAELTLAETGGVVKLSGELFGPSLGILVWRDDQRRPPAFTSMSRTGSDGGSMMALNPAR